MTDDNTITIAGHRWVLGRMPDRDAVVAECLLLGMLGPFLGRAASALLEQLADTIIEMVREAVGEGETFDLAKLADFTNVDSTDPRVEKAWTKLLEELPGVLRLLLVEALPLASDRLEPDEVLRVFDLVVLGVVHVYTDKGPRKVNDWKALGSYTKRAPGIKWELLAASLLHHYGREVVAWVVARVVAAAEAAEGAA